ncbi:histidine phosphatase family protein [Knoellia sp. p5-6-4]|uniref:histidine phosphatase family protein n=1 Tax=unclassified Knoellia TaxID=2618719 RepID=UPI0023DB5817|nr:histidine phosphatase family protein [Knoellia sp. p5-6-4]MDF2145603.1 histidine phosphatase family protein [Knoellia sp. p5-6-4]
METAEVQTEQTTTLRQPEGRLVLVRHGETEWSRTGQHTGVTDLPLTPAGEEAASGLAGALEDFDFTLVLSSPLERARRTAELAGLRPELDHDLVEWDYGAYEGLTTPQVREHLGYDWTVFEHGVAPGETPGESVEEVAARASRVVRRATSAMTAGDVVLVAHGHLLRVLTAVFLQKEPRFGAQLLLDAGALSVLEFERGLPAVRMWNRPA